MSQFVANSFQVPNALIDEMLDKISGNACKIYLLIVRKTRGWHKEADRISYSQIQKFTGINSRATISKAIDELLEMGLIIVAKGNEKSSNEYRLNDDFCSKNEPEPSSKNEPDKKCTSSKNVLASSKNVLASSKNEPDKKCTSSKNVLAGSKNEPEPSSKNEHTEIHIFKNTRIKNKSVNTHDEHTHQNFQNSQNPKSDKPIGKPAKKPKKFITADELVSLGVDEQVANDYLAIRKTKLTQTALNGIIGQAELAGITLAQAVEFACEMGWQSFRADWYANSQKSHFAPSHSQAWEQEFSRGQSYWGDGWYGNNDQPPMYQPKQIGENS